MINTESSRFRILQLLALEEGGEKSGLNSPFFSNSGKIWKKLVIFVYRPKITFPHVYPTKNKNKNLAWIFSQSENTKIPAKLTKTGILSNKISWTMLELHQRSKRTSKNVQFTLSHKTLSVNMFTHIRSLKKSRHLAAKFFRNKSKNDKIYITKVFWRENSSN